jgi:hypothetical protein
VQPVDRGRHGVLEVALDPAIARLLGIQLRRVGRQPLHLVVVRMGSQEGLHRPGAMGLQSVSDHQQRSADLAPEVAQGGDDLLALDAAAELAGVQRRWFDLHAVRI